MKKIIAIVLVVVTLLAIRFSSGGVELSVHEYIVDEKTCQSFFRCSPDEFVKKDLEMTWVNENLLSSSSSNGYLVLILNEENKKYWETFINEQIANKRKAEQEDGCGFDVNKDYTKLTFTVPDEATIGVAINIVSFVPYLGIMQMLKGTEPQNWHVDVEIVNANTGKVVNQMFFPSK